MPYKVNIHDFEGPLDLLLFFIQRDKLNIYDIPIFKITHDFLDYISRLNNMNIEVGGDFIYMASLLMKIKSKMLLPKEESEEEIIDPRHDLVLKLIEYKKFKKISDHLLMINNDYSKRYKANINSNYCDFENQSTDISIGDLNLYDIIKMYNNLIQDLPDNNLYEINNENFSIKKQIELINLKIKNKKKILFSSIIKLAKTKSYIVCTFIAILDMIKSKQIKIEQKNPFSEIYIINNAN